MPRAPFSPDADQQGILDALATLAQRRAADDAALTDLLDAAAVAGIPILVIAASAGVERKTVYRRLGHPMK